MSDSGQPPPAQLPWRPRFSLGMMLLVMLICSVVFAAGSYFWRSRNLGASDSSKFVFVVFTLAAPMVLLVVVSVGWQIALWLGRTRRR